MLINRRSFFVTTGGAIALAGCGLTSTQLQTDAELLKAGLVPINAFVIALNPPWIESYNQAYMIVFTQLIDKILNAPKAPLAADIAIGVQALINIYDLVKPNTKLPPAILDGLEAAVSLAPVFLAAAGLAGSAKVKVKYKYDIETARAKLRTIRYSNPVNLLT